MEGLRGIEGLAGWRKTQPEGKRKKAENLRVFLLPSSFFLDSVNFSASSLGIVCTWRGRECLSTLPAARQAVFGRAVAPAEHQSGEPGRL
jgi:hypothetical protein